MTRQPGYGQDRAELIPAALCWQNGALPTRVVYWAGGVVLLCAYIVVSSVAWSDRGFTEKGPLSLHAADLTAPLAGGPELSTVRAACYQQDQFKRAPGYRLRIVGGEVSGKPYYACYLLNPEGAVWAAAVLDAQRYAVRDTSVIKAGGAWRWIGTVKAPQELVLGGLGVLALLLIAFIYYRRPRPGPPSQAAPLETSLATGVMIAIPIAGWIALAVVNRRSRPRLVRLGIQTILVWSGVFVAGLLAMVSERPDVVGWSVTGMLAATFVYAVALGRFRLAPAGFGQPAEAFVAPPSAATPSVATVGPPQQPRASIGSSVTAPGQQVSQDSRFKIEEPRDLPTFTDVGGMDEVKTELSDTFGLVLAYSGEAERYKLRFNGILFHGPPGVGKTFLAKATAGEFGMNFLHVAVGDIGSKFVGESAQNVQAAFRTAVACIPCLLFFDEFDSIAQRRDENPNQEDRRTVNQLLQSLEEYRAVRELVVMAATNNRDILDPAVIRPGRFDRQVRVDLPDAAARKGILIAQLRDRPTGDDIDYDELAERCEGMTAATIASIVEAAALAAFREATASGAAVPLSQSHLLGALHQRGGKDRPTVEAWSWDKLVLADDVKAELQQMQALLEDPDAASAYGIRAPTGILLAGPPGTGKTTVARVLAAEAKCSFYPVTAGDLTSKWVGESEQLISRLFERARENAPSIIFIDEIDAIAATRGSTFTGTFDRQINQLLSEMDGMKGQRGVFVVAATNRPDQLDPALTRGGRLSRTIWIPVPDKPARRRLIELFSANMPLLDVDMDALADATDGLSGADLEALCQEAAVHAMVRDRQSGGRTGGAPQVTSEDFRSAVEVIRSSRRNVLDPNASD